MKKPNQPNEDSEVRNHAVVDVMAFLAGIVLPAATLGIEMQTGMSRDGYLDPIPSRLNVLLIALVPIVNLSLKLSSKSPDYPRLRSTFSGIAIGTALVYSIAYLPMLPIAAFAVMFFGMGLLPAAPLFSLGATFFYRAQWNAGARRASRPQLPWSYTWAGIAIVVIGPILTNIPFHRTQHGLMLALSARPGEQVEGIKYLRENGSERELEDWCAGKHREVLDLLVLARTLPGLNVATDQGQAENVYYRVTGNAFDWSKRTIDSDSRLGMLDPELGLFFRRRRATFNSAFAMGQQFENRRGLRLAHSDLRGWVDGQALHGYLEWTMSIANQGVGQREAIAQLQLPPGGVVSRVTLWVDGEEREAAFASRAKTTAAYENIVRRKKDPVLITTQGPNQVQMKCFPVPAKGEMMFRLGITFPLIPETDGAAFGDLPSIIEANFSRGQTHRIGIQLVDSDSAFVGSTGSNWTLDVDAGGEQLLVGEVADEQLGNWHDPIAVVTGTTRDSWASNHILNPKYPKYISQSVVVDSGKTPQRIMVVLEGSKSMAAYADQVAAGLSDLQLLLKEHPAIEIGICIASDGVQTLLPFGVHNPVALEDALANLERFEFVGGQESATALGATGAILGNDANSALLWIFGPQPELHTETQLEDLLEAELGDVPVLGIPVEAGTNGVQSFLNNRGMIKTLPQYLGLERSLQALIGRWRGAPNLVVNRKPIESVEGITASAQETSSHLVRLWAVDQTLAILRKADLTGAQKLAQNYQLVTSVTGAVVLETKAMYEEAGLQPVDPSSVPSVPEPEFYLLVCVAGVFVLAAWRMKVAG